MSGPILSLALEPLRDDQSYATAPLQVYYSDLVEPGKDRSSGAWKAIRSDGDYRRTNQFLNEIQTIQVSSKPLVEFISWDGLGLWQFLPSYIWPEFYRAVDLAHVLRLLFQQVKPSRIRVHPVTDRSNNIWRGVVEAAAKQRGIPVEFLVGESAQSNSTRVRLLSRISRRLLRDRDRLVSRFQIQMAKLALRFGEKIQPAGKKLLFASFSRHWVSAEERGKKYDEQFFPLLQALRERGWTQFLGIDCPYSGDPKRLVERLKDDEPGVRWKEFFDYMPTGKVSGSLRDHFHGLWIELSKDQEFRKSFSYQGVELFSAMEQELSQAFHQTLPEVAQMLLTAREMLRREKPDAVIATYETGPYQRAIIIEAARLGIPTVGLMHGMIFGNHYDYMHENVSLNPIQRPFGFAIPRATCVWGEFWKKNLTEKGTYPPAAVFVTGNWRYDELPWKSLNPTEMRKRYAVPNDKKLVLIISAGLNTVRYVKECLNVIRSDKELFPLVRLHPSDNPAPVRELIATLGYPPETIVAGRLIEPLFAADIVLSQVSTAVSEAILAQKPVILINFEKDSGWVDDYVSSEACLYATDAAELEDALLLLRKQEVISNLDSARKRFIESFFYRLDGKSAQRLAEVVEKLIDQPEGRIEAASSYLDKSPHLES